MDTSVWRETIEQRLWKSSYFYLSQLNLQWTADGEKNIFVFMLEAHLQRFFHEDFEVLNFILNIVGNSQSGSSHNQIIASE